MMFHHEVFSVLLDIQFDGQLQFVTKAIIRVTLLALHLPILIAVCKPMRHGTKMLAILYGA